MKISVVGSYNMDMTINVPRIPQSGETILGGSFSTAAGGKGANQAVAVSRSGGQATLIARLGNDLFGSKAIEELLKDNINVDFIKKDDKLPTGVAEIFVAKTGENCIAVASGANNNLSVYDIIDAKKAIVESDILLMQMEVPIETIEYAAKLACDANIRVILNPAPAQKLSLDLLKSIDILTPNQVEAELLTGIRVEDENSAEDAGKILISKGVKKVIITMGERGAMLIDSSGSELIPSYPVHAVDSTAAGDVFNGALAVGIAENKPVGLAVKFANAAAALSVTKLGAQPSIPGREEILKFM